MIAEVILELSIGKTLDYFIPEEFREKIKKGAKVEVPLRGHLRRGYVMTLKESSSFPNLEKIARVDEEVITEELFELALWISKYYFTSLSAVVKTILPGSIRKQIEPRKQWLVKRAKSREELSSICIEMRKSHPEQAAVLEALLPVTKAIFLSELLELTGTSRSPVESLEKKGLIILEQVKSALDVLQGEEYFQTKPKLLGEEQKKALDTIVESMQKGTFASHLLFGVTGSGKTEVYLQAIQETLQKGKSTIMLVPEISLTAQTVERLKSRFKEHIAILHHRLSDGERFEEWHKIKSGSAKIIVGARSAIFCPAKELGLIIVDEEHENSYKQSDEMPCYHARDVAVMRAYLQKATIVLGSATPSLESFWNASEKKYSLSTLTKRPGLARLPHVHVIDMKRECDKAGRLTLFSDALIEGIKKRSAIGEQAILFLNRRGYHTQFLCKGCDFLTKCPHCDLNLTYHFEGHLACHLCGFSQKPHTQCPACGSKDTLFYRGAGTEQVERALHAIFPEIRTLRIDADTTRHKGTLDQLLRAFRTGKADVLIGTQMISKGHHFPAVTLVGVLNADASFGIPDFRASENGFQLITQVAGRAGRELSSSEVILQSFLPDHSTIGYAKEQNFLAFYQEEIEVRRHFGYPPFTHMIKCTFIGLEEKKTQKTAEQLFTKLRVHIQEPFFMNQVTKAGYAKIKDKFRFQFLLRGPSVYQMNKKLEAALKEFPLPHTIILKIDVDPISTF